MHRLDALGAIAFLEDDGVAWVDLETLLFQRDLEGGEARLVTPQVGVAAEPADTAVTEAVEVVDDFAQGLRLVAEHGVAVTDVAGGHRDDCLIDRPRTHRVATSSVPRHPPGCSYLIAPMTLPRNGFRNGRSIHRITTTRSFSWSM